MFPSTTERVAMNTADEINRQIAQETEANIGWYAASGREAIDERLRELDREWDIERLLEANAATLSLIGVVLGATTDRRWFALPALVSGFLLQHALVGWCPPVPLLRRLGIRTAAEIDRERYALKAIRGDFEEIPSLGEPRPVDVRRVMMAVSR